MARFQTWCAGVALAAGVAAGAAFGQAQDAKPKDKGKLGEAMKEAQQALEGADAQMEAWIRAGTPGEMHRHLDPFVGSWTITTKTWMDPAAPEPEVSSATSKVEWQMDGRYLHEHFEGNMGGMPFKGLGIAGYDNMKKEYFSIWMDSMSTGAMMTTGQRSADGKTFTYTGDFVDPVTSKKKTTRIIITMVSKDQHNFEMWGEEDGKPWKMMEMAYKRSS